MTYGGDLDGAQVICIAITTSNHIYISNPNTNQGTFCSAVPLEYLSSNWAISKEMP